jgi:hypothetical protein
MTTETQDAGTATHDAGGTQTTDPAASTTQAAQTDTSTADATKATETAAEVEYKFDMPEGVKLDEGDLTKFTDIAKELKLPADAAKKLVDLAAAREVARAEAFAKQVETWGNEVKADPELGKAENLATAKKTIDTFGTPELRDLLNSTGMGNHPEVIRMALKIGKAISEDTFVAGRSGGNAPPRDHATILYGNSPTK